MHISAKVGGVQGHLSLEVVEEEHLDRFRLGPVKWVLVERMCSKVGRRIGLDQENRKLRCEMVKPCGGKGELER